MLNYRVLMPLQSSVKVENCLRSLHNSAKTLMPYVEQRIGNSLEMYELSPKLRESTARHYDALQGGEA